MATRFLLHLRKQPLLGAGLGISIVIGCSGAGFDSKQDGGQYYGQPDTGIVIPQDGKADDAADAVVSTTGINPLCGEVSIDCGNVAPDDATACEDFLPTGTGGTTGAGGSSATGGAPEDGGVDAALNGSSGGTSATDGGLDAAAIITADGAPAKGIVDGGSVIQLGTFNPPAPAPVADAGALYACQVVSAENGLPIRRCTKAGPGGIGAPCAATTDCRAGMACVGTEGAGQCRPYCCDSETQCGLEPSDQEGGHGRVTYCGERPLLEGSGSTTRLMVPVCVPADGCRLEEPYPCTSGSCTCTADTACTVVDEGTTSCVKPGTGTQGEACPCASGYYCSQSTQSCVKVCKTSQTDSACSPGQCQATAGFPDGFGLCVGLL